MKIHKRQFETEQQLIKRFSWWVRESGILQDLEARRFFVKNGKKKMLKQRKHSELVRRIRKI